jgi:hypothetical protein
MDKLRTIIGVKTNDDTKTMYSVAHLRRGAKGANAPGGKILGAAKYSNFYYCCIHDFFNFYTFFGIV